MQEEPVHNRERSPFRGPQWPPSTQQLVEKPEFPQQQPASLVPKKPFQNKREQSTLFPFSTEYGHLAKSRHRERKSQEYHWVLLSIKASPILFFISEKNHGMIILRIQWLDNKGLVREMTHMGESLMEMSQPWSETCPLKIPLAGMYWVRKGEEVRLPKTPG